MKILLIEDDQSESSFIKRGLEEQGHVVMQAFDGKTGLKFAYQDDYLTRPFKFKELIARVKTLNSSGTFADKNGANVQDPEMNLKSMEVYRDGGEIKLTARKFRLLLELTV